jgi:hypothetical protein
MTMSFHVRFIGRSSATVVVAKETGFIETSFFGADDLIVAFFWSPFVTAVLVVDEEIVGDDVDESSVGSARTGVLLDETVVVESDIVDVPSTSPPLDIALPYETIETGSTNVERTESQERPPAAGMAYAVAHTRLSIGIELGSTAPSSCCIFHR